MYYCVGIVWDSACSAAYFDCIEGCTYPQACNYSSLAWLDDQSCVFPGCTDPLALNYDQYAGCDNGSCIMALEPPCAGDLNNDNVVNVADLTIFLSTFGNSCETP